MALIYRTMLCQGKGENMSKKRPPITPPAPPENSEDSHPDKGEAQYNPFADDADAPSDVQDSAEGSSPDVMADEKNPFKNFSDLPSNDAQDYPKVPDEDNMFLKIVSQPKPDISRVNKASDLPNNPFLSETPQAVVVHSDPNLPVLHIEAARERRIKKLIDKLKGLSGTSEQDKAEIYLGIGKELMPHIEAAKLPAKDAKSSALKILTDLGWDVTNPITGSILRLSKLFNIDAWVWLGWENLILLVSIEKNKVGKFKEVIDAIYGSNPPAQDAVDVEALNKKLKRYKNYKSLCKKCGFKTSNSLSFSKFDLANANGIDFSNAELQEELKKKNRPDAYIDSILQGTDRPPLPQRKPAYISKRQPDDIKTLITRLKNEIQERLDNAGAGTTIMPDEFLEDFLIVAIDYFNASTLATDIAEYGIDGKFRSRKVVFDRIIEHIKKILEQDK